MTVRHRYGILGCFETEVLTDPQAGQYRWSFAHLCSSNRFSAALSSGNKRISSGRVIPRR